MLGSLNVGVQIVKVIQPRRVLLVLNDGQLTRLGEPSQLARTHAEIQSRFFRSQQPSRDVTCNAHLPSRNQAQSRHNDFPSLQDIDCVRHGEAEQDATD
jgi:hypothetical protein